MGLCTLNNEGLFLFSDTLTSNAWDFALILIRNNIFPVNLISHLDKRFVAHATREERGFKTVI
jgi:hypothetical protein